MTEDFRIFLATINGEAAASSPAAWRAIASVIMNRVGFKEWAQMTTPRAVIERSGFDAYWAKNAPYKEAYRAFETESAHANATPRMRALEDAVRAIFEKLEAPVTPAVLYFSPRAQAALHYSKPQLYAAMPRWNFAAIEEVQPPGMLPTDDFRFFRYRKAIT